MPLLLDLFLTFMQIGLFTIGGGYAMIPIINSMVLAKGWLNAEQIINFISISEAAPGPFAINIATFVGFETAGVLGVLMAVLGLLLPSFIIIFVIYKISKKFLENKHVGSALKALRPAVVGLLISAFVAIAWSTFAIQSNDNNTLTFNWFGVILFAIAFFVITKFKKVPTILVFVGGAVLGILFYGFIL